MDLERFGFTPTESKAYVALLTLGPSTGYAVGRQIGVARANAYQALDGLVRRRAAQKVAAAPALYTPTVPGVLIANLERAYRKDLSDLEDRLRAVSASPTAEPPPVTVGDPDALLDHAAELCRAARSELLVVMGPWASSLIAPIAIARGRGATVRAVSLGEPAPEGATIRPTPISEIRSYWGGFPLLVISDRAQAVCGVIAEGGRSEGLVCASRGLVPFLRHLVRREFGGGAA
jgi:sugar-specific transcriptional regulator TrmB